MPQCEGSDNPILDFAIPTANGSSLFRNCFKILVVFACTIQTSSRLCRIMR